MAYRATATHPAILQVRLGVTTATATRVVGIAIASNGASASGVGAAHERPGWAQERPRAGTWPAYKVRASGFLIEIGHHELMTAQIETQSRSSTNSPHSIHRTAGSMHIASKVTMAVDNASSSRRVAQKGQLIVRRSLAKNAHGPRVYLNCSH